MSTEKQIEEMAKHCQFSKEGKCFLFEDGSVKCDMNCDMHDFTAILYNAGYRKQSDGEWIDTFGGDDIQRCSVCNHMFYYPKLYKYHYCPNCGAKMKGGGK